MEPVISITESIDCRGSYTVVTERGRFIEVETVGGEAYVDILLTDADQGRQFSSIAAACEHYQDRDIKHALRLLAEL